MNRIAKLLSAKEETKMVEFAPDDAVLITLDDLDRIDGEIALAEPYFTRSEMADYEEWLYQMELKSAGYWPEE